jgi:hypothetical protein
VTTRSTDASAGSGLKSRADRPPLVSAGHRAAISRVSDTWPPLGPEKRKALLEHVRDVWVLHGIESNCVAGLYQTTFGIELRIHQNNEMVESRLSR